MNTIKLLFLFIIMNPALYAMRDTRSADERYKQWCVTSQSPENVEKRKAKAAAVQESAKIIARDLKCSVERAALLPTSIHEHIWSFITVTNRKFLAQNMQRLIPAVVTFGDGNLFFLLTRAYREQLSLLATSEFYCVSGEKLESPLTEPKIASNPDSFCAYRHSKTPIYKVCPRNFKALESCTMEQLEYIAELYTTRLNQLQTALALKQTGHGVEAALTPQEETRAEWITLTPEQWAINESLPLDQSRRLMQNYSLQVGIII